jgi:aryl-phospho-beta-D-glucosidase BglC (GH1 family)
MKKSTRSAAAVLLIIIFCINRFLSLSLIHKAEAASLKMRDLKAADIVSEMGIGWNLGNAFESYGDYGSDTNYKLSGFYMDGESFAWSMSPKISFVLSEDMKSATAMLSWKLKSIKSTDNSRTHSLGFQIWNFSDHLPAGSHLSVEVLRAEIRTGGNIYTFSGLMGRHNIIMDAGGVASFRTKEFDDDFTDSGKIKAGTLTLKIKLTTPKIESKQEFYETNWGNPLTTKALIDQLKTAGFNAVRIPVTWFPSMDSEDHIDEAWLKRLEEVVNYILDNDMYCILNLHHDSGHATDAGSGWLKADTSDQAMVNRFTRLWEQIATRFKDYSDYLLFEGFNEILIRDSHGKDIWGYPGVTAVKAVNELNQIFVDTVRSTGGNNAKRHPVVNTYAACPSQANIDAFVLPADSIEDHLIVEVHEYEPMEFGYYKVTHTPLRDTWGTSEDKESLDSIFERLNKRFISNGIPVIIGEFATCNKNNTGERAEHAGYYIASAKRNGIVCFWWDNGGNFEAGKSKYYRQSGLINRRTLKWVFPEIVDAMMVSAYPGR